MSLLVCLLIFFSQHLPFFSLLFIANLQESSLVKQRNTECLIKKTRLNRNEDENKWRSTSCVWSLITRSSHFFSIVVVSLNRKRQLNPCFAVKCTFLPECVMSTWDLLPFVDKSHTRSPGMRFGGRSFPAKSDGYSQTNIQIWNWTLLNSSYQSRKQGLTGHAVILCLWEAGRDTVEDDGGQWCWFGS